MIREFEEFDKNVLRWKYRKLETVLEKKDHELPIVRYP